MITRARLSFFGVPSLKVRRFAGTIKGEPVERAIAILAVQSSPTCQALHKLLRSAVANAEHNNQINAKYLVVSNVLVDQGPSLRRIQARARGRAYRFVKRTSHVTIEVGLKPGVTQELIQAEAGDAKKARRGKAAEAKPATAKGKAQPAPEQAKAQRVKKSTTKGQGEEKE